MTYDKPLPTLRGEERIWFDGAREGRAIYQHCADCGQDVFYTRALCPNCWSEKLEERIASGGGTVYSFTVQRRPGTPAFADQVPYALVLVDLDEGVRVLADITDCAAEDIRVGMPVRMWFDDVTDEMTLPRFRPASREEI